jgi:hypothetical protein
MEIQAQTSQFKNKLESLQETNGISPNYTNATAKLFLPSDRTSSITTISTSVILKNQSPGFRTAKHTGISSGNQRHLS